MKKIAFPIVLFLLILPVILAYNVDITLNSNDIATEHIAINVPIGYDSYEFSVPYKPLAIIYEGDYVFNDNVITFFDNSKNILDFTLIYSDMVEHSNQEKTFRVSFDDANNITLALPKGNILSKEPSTIPAPKSISTDGERIILNWENEDSVAVFYHGEKNSILLVVAIFSTVVLAAVIFFNIYSKQKLSRKISEILSDDENLIINELKKGASKQKEISKNLNFSKSKMSKVIRKLEEKNLIEKKPHFKTNIIKLKN